MPPTLLAYCQAAEQGKFPRDHHMRWVKSGAAPLAPELARRFTAGTGIPIRQGYGMTEASPVTHMGFLAPELYRPESVGAPVAQTECRVVDEKENDVAQGEIGELVMRGPQFMLGYWKSPDATAAVLRDGWYWTGDIVRVDERGLYYVVDRRKEMMKYKGFSIAPAEVESVLLEHPLVRDCGVVSRTDAAGEEIPCAFVVLREGEPPNQADCQPAAGLRGRAADPLQNAARSLFRADPAADSIGQDSAARAAEAGVKRFTTEALRTRSRRKDIALQTSAAPRVVF